MRLTVTAVDTVVAARADLLLDADPDTPVADVALALASELRGASSAPRGAGAAVLRLPSAGPVSTGEPRLFVNGAGVDPATTLADSPLRDGSLVSLDDPTGGVAPEPPGIVEVRVVSGPGAGVVHRLGVGRFEIGTAVGNGVRLELNAAPERVGSLSVDVEGAASFVPASGVTARLDGEPVERETRWAPGALLAAGQVLLALTLPVPADAALTPSDDGCGLDYNRPPRMLPPVRETRFRLPSPPADPERRPLPIAMALTPLAGAIGIALYTGRMFYLMFAVLSPIALVANHLSERRRGKKSHRRQAADYRAHKERIEQAARAALIAERDERRSDAPDPAELLLAATGPRTLLWRRRRHDPDHLVLRFGTADLPSDVVLEDPTRDEHDRSVTWTVHDVPAAVPVVERGVVGVAGRGDLARALGRWALVQAAVLHSPADVQVYLLTDSAAAVDWDWVRWLPHARPGDGQDGAVVLVGNDSETVAARVAELSAIVAARMKARTSAGIGTSAMTFREPDVFVVYDGARRLRSLPAVVPILRDGPSVGVYALCLDADRRLLPEECQAVVEEQADGQVRVELTRAGVVAGVRPDLVPVEWCERVARALAPIRDVSGVDDEATLPTSSRLLDVLGLEPPTAQAVSANWLVGGRTTAAVIGECADGAFALDLRVDGPHGLVAGTTGAGKSEFLQTVVASLAVANRPDAMTFVLVDYKGGAAFKDCVDLPHTVGMVTDLDAHLVERALESLGAELRRREHQLAAAGAKDIEDYLPLLDRDPGMQPLPRLVIVIDEFASMARELPEFVTGLVNVAQRGRSLGIHLILATQRPTGVVSPEIRANTNLRIALRMTDSAESSDVIDAPDAGRISKSTPGRAYARLGHASLVAFQASRVGGRRPGAVSATLPEPWLATLGWSRLGRPMPTRPKAKAAAVEEETDLRALVAAIREADHALGLPPQRRPWLPALGETILLDTLVASDRAADGAAVPPTAAVSCALPAAPYGLVDFPAEQVQRPAAVDFATFGHLLVSGAPRSGRSQLLRTIAGSIARVCSPADAHIYGIDCGNGALLPLADLPHCGAVVSRTQTERATRLLARLASEVDRRQEVLAERGFASIGEQRAGVSEAERLPHIVVLLDRWEGFSTTLGELDGGQLTDIVFKLLREGASAGVHVVIAGDRSVLAGRIAALTEDRITFRLADPTDYSLLGLNPRTIPDNPVPGRAFTAGTGTELQVALLDADPSGAGQAAALASIARSARQAHPDIPRKRRPFRVDVLPARITFADAWSLAGAAARPGWAMVGVGGDELTSYGVDLADGAGTFVIAGPAKSGRSTAAMCLTRSLLAGGTTVVVVAPRRSPLRELAGVDGVIGVLTGDNLAEDDVAPLFEGVTGPAALVMDDGEMFKECPARDWLREYLRVGRGQSRWLVLAGSSDEICTGLSGWQNDVKRGRRGLVLSPQNINDSDLIGARLPRGVIGGAIVPGRGFLHAGDGELRLVQVPV